MKLKLYFFLTLAACFISVANGQIGAISIAPTKLAITTIGAGDNYGKSNLPVCVPRNVSCSQAFTYTFIGNGNWTIESNWEGNAIPPAILPVGGIIIIDPVQGGECILNVVQTIATGASIKIKAGKKLKLQSHLSIQN